MQYDPIAHKTTDMPTDTYIPYGPEWKLEVMKMTKEQIIDHLLAPALKGEKGNDDLWFPSELPPKDGTIVLGEDAEGCPYVVKFLKGDVKRPCNDDDCSHPDHYEDHDFDTCTSIGEGFYETLEQLGNEREYIPVRREIMKWRSIPKSN